MCSLRNASVVFTDVCCFVFCLRLFEACDHAITGVSGELGGDDVVFCETGWGIFDIYHEVAFDSAAWVWGLCFDQDLGDLVYETLAELVGEFHCQFLKLLGPVFNYSGVEMVGHFRGWGACSQREGEDVDFCEACVLGKFEGLMEIGVGFAWEAYDDIGGDGGSVEAGFGHVDSVFELIGGVLAAHLFEDSV